MALVNAFGAIALDTSVQAVKTSTDTVKTSTDAVKSSVDLTNTRLLGGVPLLNTITETAYSLAGVIAINTDLLIIDCTDFSSLSIQVTSMGTAGVITPNWSNDGSTYNTANFSTPAGALVSTLTAAGIWRTEVCGKYLRLRLTTATTGGTTSLVVHGRKSPMANAAQGVLAGASASLIGDVSMQYRAGSTGAASGTHIVSAATANPTVVKASAGRVVGWSFANTTASWRYVKLHNQTTTPTAGTGVVRTIAIPPNGVNVQSLPGGIAFTTGIALTTVTGAADSDATVVALNDIVGDLFYA